MKGDVVVVPFPFSDLTGSRRRPALVVAELEGDDVMLCQITSQEIRDRYALPIEPSDFETGSLQKPSNVRANRITTAERRLVLYKAGHLTRQKTNEIIDRLAGLLRE